MMRKKALKYSPELISEHSQFFIKLALKMALDYIDTQRKQVYYKEALHLILTHCTQEQVQHWLSLYFTQKRCLYSLDINQPVIQEWAKTGIHQLL